MSIIKDKNGYLYAKENLGKSERHAGKFDIAITPLHPHTGEKITKRELYGKNSNQAAIFHIYAANETKALELIFPKLAEETILPAMIAAGIVSVPESLDLRSLFSYHKDEIMEYCRSQSKRPWQESTVEGYSGQYSLMLDDMADIYPEDLTMDGYCYLQGLICQSAAQSSHDKEAWVQYGDEAPKSAQKRLNFLYQGLIYLELQDLIELPIVPFKYAGTPGRENELKQILGKPRSYPDSVQREFLTAVQNDVLSGLIAACGLRISEAAGLLGCSIFSIHNSQGSMHCLAVFGQLDSNGKYKEYGKSSAAYRCIPIPDELAQTLSAKLKASSTVNNSCVDTLLLSTLLNGTDNNDRKMSLLAKENTENIICSFLRKPSVQEQLYQNVPFCYNERSQKESLKAASTVHSLRRNFCTWLHCFSGLRYEEIFYLMGHSQGRDSPRPSGKSNEELQRMCLHEFVSASAFHPQNPLFYRADQSWNKMDVPACKLILDIPAGWKGTVIITSTEPQNDIQITPSQPQNIKVKLQNVSIPYPMTDALLANEDAMKIVSIKPAFE